MAMHFEFIGSEFKTRVDLVKDLERHPHRRRTSLERVHDRLELAVIEGPVGNGHTVSVSGPLHPVPPVLRAPIGEYLITVSHCEDHDGLGRPRGQWRIMVEEPSHSGVRICKITEDLGSREQHHGLRTHRAWDVQRGGASLEHDSRACAEDGPPRWDVPHHEAPERVGSRPGEACAIDSSLNYYSKHTNIQHRQGRIDVGYSRSRVTISLRRGRLLTVLRSRRPLRRCRITLCLPLRGVRFLFRKPQRLERLPEALSALP